MALFLLATLMLTASCSDDNPVISNPDNTAPAAITDLVASNPTGNSVVLTWTAPGDDGDVAKAAEYDIRYSTTLITASNWSSATSFSNPIVPTTAGGEQCDTITGLSSTTKYYFAIRTGDEVPNWSEISNVDSMTTYLPGTWTVYTVSNSDLPSNTVTAIDFHTANTRYITTLGGMAFINGTQWNIYTAENSDIVSNSLTAVADDPTGIIWIGSWGNGISSFNGTAFETYDEASTGEAIDFISSVAVVNQNFIWFGSSTSGLFSFENPGWINYNIDSGLHVNMIGSLGFDGDGNLWIGYNPGGVAKYDGVTFENFDANGELTYQGVSSIAYHGNTMWFGTDVGVYTFNGSTWTSYNTSNSDLPSNTVLSLTQDSGGDWWFGTAGGLCRYDGSNWMTYTTENSPLPHNHVNVVKVDPVGTIWVGTSGGLGVLNP